VYPGDLPLFGTWRGRDAIRDFLGQLGGLFEPGTPLTLEVTGLLSAGDQVVAEWTSARRPGRRRLPQREHRRVHGPQRRDHERPGVHRHPARRAHPVRHIACPAR
jgi:hypothetical protein